MTVIPVPGLGYALARFWPDGEHDCIPVLAFVVDPDEIESGEPPNVITPTGDSLHSDGFMAAVVMPDGGVFHGGQEFSTLQSFVTACKKMRRRK